MNSDGEYDSDSEYDSGYDSDSEYDSESDCADMEAALDWIFVRRNSYETDSDDEVDWDSGSDNDGDVVMWFVDDDVFMRSFSDSDTWDDY